MEASGSGPIAAKRPWWRRKRWWAVAFVVWFVASRTIPWSLEGPAMSCWEAMDKHTAKKKIVAIAGDDSSGIVNVSKFLNRSGFIFINSYLLANGQEIDKNDYMLSVTFHTYSLNARCFPLHIISDTYPSAITLLFHHMEGKKYEIISVNGEKVDGGNQD